MEPDSPETNRPAPNPASASHEPRIATPVMDVVPPPASSGLEPGAVPSSAVALDSAQPASSSASDTAAAQPAVVPPPEADGDDLLASELQASTANNQDAGTAPQPTAPAQAPSRNPTVVPIIMTIVVVCVLAALAIFAYMKSR